MTKTVKLSLALMAASVLSWVGVSAWAAGHNGSPCAPGYRCTPNVCGFGYFDTSWREWPCERRPDKTMPGAIGREAVPPPPGGYQPAIPRAAIPLEPPSPAPLEPRSPTPLEPRPPRNVEPSSPTDGMIPVPEGLLPKPPEARPPAPLTEPATPIPVPPALREGAEQPAERDLPKKEPAATPPKPAEPKPAEPKPAEPVPGVPTDPTGSVGPQAAPTAAVAPAGAAAPSAVANSSQRRGGLVSRLQAVMDARQAPEPREATANEGRALAEPTATGVWPETQAPAVPLTPAAYAPPMPETPTEPLPPVVQPAAEPVQQVEHQQPVELNMRPAALPQVYNQRADEPAPAAQGAWQPEQAAAMEGYCPVALGKNEQWVLGDARFAVTHQGRTYWTSGAVERECFLADPDRYVPACAGLDPVLLTDEGRKAPGAVDYCVTYEGKLYMFSSPATLARFRQDLRRYQAALER